MPLGVELLGGVPCPCADGSVSRWLVVGLLGGVVPTALLLVGAMLARRRGSDHSPARERPPAVEDDDG